MTPIPCRTCKHNCYVGNPELTAWVLCVHPKTIAQRPSPSKGDPAWVDMMTADVAAHELHIAECATYEQVAQPKQVNLLSSQKEGT